MVEAAAGEAGGVDGSEQGLVAVAEVLVGADVQPLRAAAFLEGAGFDFRSGRHGGGDRAGGGADGGRHSQLGGVVDQKGPSWLRLA